MLKQGPDFLLRDKRLFEISEFDESRLYFSAYHHPFFEEQYAQIKKRPSIMGWMVVEGLNIRKASAVILYNSVCTYVYLH